VTAAYFLISGLEVGLPVHDKGLSRENTHLLDSLKEFPEASPWSRQWHVDFPESIRFGSANAAA
jgi:hypothetical protein